MPNADTYCCLPCNSSAVRILRASDAPASRGVYISQIRLEPHIAAWSRFDGSLEFADGVKDEALEEEGHAELEVCARMLRCDLERSADFRDRAIVLTRRPVCDSEIHVCAE